MLLEYELSDERASESDGNVVNIFERKRLDQRCR